LLHGFWLWLGVLPAARSQVQITEFMATGGTLRDENGDTPDWIVRAPSPLGNSSQPANDLDYCSAEQRRRNQSRG
jgi:hypothetical protein